MAKKEVNNLHVVVSETANRGPLKRGRGRPRKISQTVNKGESSGVKRGRGRPRKISQTVNQEGESSGVKRGRGRPRKERVVSQGASSGSSAKRGRPRKNKLPPTEEPSVGEEVRGRVVEAINDDGGGGYLLNVRIGNCPINFRGFVFKSDSENSPPKRKYEPQQAHVPTVHPAGVRGKLVQVVLKPVHLPYNGSVIAPQGFDNGGSSSVGGLPEDCTHQFGNAAADNANANGGPFSLTKPPHLS